MTIRSTALLTNQTESSCPRWQNWTSTEPILRSLIMAEWIAMHNTPFHIPLTDVVASQHSSINDSINYEQSFIFRAIFLTAYFY